MSGFAPKGAGLGPCVRFAVGNRLPLASQDQDGYDHNAQQEHQPDASEAAARVSGWVEELARGALSRLNGNGLGRLRGRRRPSGAPAPRTERRNVGDVSSAVRAAQERHRPYPCRLSAPAEDHGERNPEDDDGASCAPRVRVLPDGRLHDDGARLLRRGWGRYRSSTPRTRGRRVGYLMAAVGADDEWHGSQTIRNPVARPRVHGWATAQSIHTWTRRTGARARTSVDACARSGRHAAGRRKLRLSASESTCANFNGLRPVASTSHLRVSCGWRAALGRPFEHSSILRQAGRRESRVGRQGDPRRLRGVS